MPITRTPWIDDDGTGTTGTILNNAEKQALYNQIDAAISAGGVGWGLWQQPPYAAGDYRGVGGMIWTVVDYNVSMNRYTIIGKTLIWNVYIAGATTSGTPANALLLKIPGGVAARSVNAGTAATSQFYDGIHQPGFATVDSDPNFVILQKITEANLSIGVTYIRFSLALELA